jgi:hypothetical protein
MDIAGPIDYATRCGIILNAERIEQRRAVNVLAGVSVALGNMKLGKEWFDATAHTTEEADAEFNKYEAKERRSKESRMF